MNHCNDLNFFSRRAKKADASKKLHDSVKSPLCLCSSISLPASS
jgi:hypothetical protein